MLIGVGRARSLTSPISVEMFWEEGNPDGSPQLSTPLHPSFSLNTDSVVGPCSDDTSEPAHKQCKCGTPAWYGYSCEKNFGISELHSIEMVTNPPFGAREGNGVVKFYADGRNSRTSGVDGSNRAEFAPLQGTYRFYPDDEVYYGMSFYAPSQYWDTVASYPYAIILSQFKMDSSPHGKLRLSNSGDYHLYYAGGSGTFDSEHKSYGNAADGAGVDLGVVEKNAWHDVKIYTKMKLDNTGAVRVYLNGELKFSWNGRTLISDGGGGGGYVKFGMYTEIRDEKTVYMDAVTYNVNRLPTGFSSLEEWGTSGKRKPTCSLLAPADGSTHSSGAAISLRATAEDPGGELLDTPGNISKVSFFARDDDCLLGEVRSPPYEYEWTPAFDGEYSVRAIAVDADGNTAVTPRVKIQSGNKSPTVSLVLPTKYADVRTSSTETLRASANDPDGTIAAVSFFVLLKDGSSASLVGTATVPMSPGGNIYEVIWNTPSASGAYSVYAVASDNGGDSTMSQYTGVTVGAVVTSTVMEPTHDATIKTRMSERDDNANYGQVELFGRAPDSNGDDQFIAGIWKIVLSSMTSASAAEVQSAKLRLYATDVAGEDSRTGGRFSVWSTTGAESWEEGSVTYNNGPSRGVKVSATEVDSANQYWDFDVTADLDAKLKAGVDLSSVTYWVQPDELETERLIVYSIRSTNPSRPQLAVTYADIAIPSAVAPTPATLTCSELTKSPGPAAPLPSGVGGGSPSPPNVPATEPPPAATEPPPAATGPPPAATEPPPANVSTTKPPPPPPPPPPRSCNCSAGTVNDNLWGAVIGTFFVTCMMNAAFYWVYRKGKSVAVRRVLKGKYEVGVLPSIRNNHEDWNGATENGRALAAVTYGEHSPEHQQVSGFALPAVPLSPQ